MKTTRQVMLDVQLEAELRAERHRDGVSRLWDYVRGRSEEGLEWSEALLIVDSTHGDTLRSVLLVFVMAWAAYDDGHPGPLEPLIDRALAHARHFLPHTSFEHAALAARVDWARRLNDPRAERWASELARFEILDE